jgi:hypothetical protein
MALLVLATIAAPHRADAKTVEIAGNGTKKTLSCGPDDVIRIGGNGNRLTVTGNCGALEIAGNKNKVDIESVASVDVPGNDNEVTWRKGPGGKADEQPKTSVLGSRNKVLRAK